ncbi:MAG: aminotransferase class I/II-fold pyridoxal phosphate-dependent enzyme [Chloroflexota bacterium]
MTIKPRPEILNAAPAVHGAFDSAELERLGLSPDEVIDFSVNSNPYGPPPGVREAIANVPLDRYPDRECIALRRKLAEHHGGSRMRISIENVLVGNGTSELLQLIALAYLRAEHKVLILKPTFSEYERVIGLAGATTVAIELHPNATLQEQIERTTH